MPFHVIIFDMVKTQLTEQTKPRKTSPDSFTGSEGRRWLVNANASTPVHFLGQISVSETLLHCSDSENIEI